MDSNVISINFYALSLCYSSFYFKKIKGICKLIPFSANTFNNILFFIYNSYFATAFVLLP